MLNSGIVYGLLAAALFGASTPFAKLLTGAMTPILLAGLLYLGSGLGLLIWLGLRAALAQGKHRESASVTARDLPWLAGAIAAGGIAGPILLMTGLAVTPASTASLLLNIESVLTALLAWFVFRENFDRRVFAGMLLIVIAGILLSWEQTPQPGLPWGALAIVGACLCWAIDNNLTRKVSASDAVQIAAIKGLAAGAVNLSLAAMLGARWPSSGQIAASLSTGFVGYGLSLVLFVMALRHLGAARTAAYFSAAPFVGVAISLVVLAESPGRLFWIASLFMAVGLWLHLSEKHGHYHLHKATRHRHLHAHDAHHHHQHEHDFHFDGQEPHTHEHQHPPTAHSHQHFPDIHHRHEH